MSEIALDKPGPVGGSPERWPEEDPDAAAPVTPEMPRKVRGSTSEGVPDLTTASAAGELPPAEPSVTQASPDVPESDKPVPELIGANLQPVEDREPQGSGPREPIPRAEPETSSASDTE